MYASHETLSARDLPRSPDVAQALDTDEDGKVKGAEFEGLADIPPHLVVRVVFGGLGGPSGAEPTRLELESLADTLKSAGVTVHEMPRRLVLAWNDARIQIFVNEDPLLQTASVSAADLDDDGKLSEYETTQYMSRRLAVYRGLIRGRAADAADRWFAVLDHNGDGNLSFREIQESQERLNSLDRNDDGQIQSHEVPCCLAIGFVRGNPSQDDELFAQSIVTHVTDPTLPRWFTGMDSNEDGEVSRREFLGTAAQFADLDKNGDGFIGRDEGSGF
jgi:Ca2+-binding EF-hand superfamily protein